MSSALCSSAPSLRHCPADPTNHSCITAEGAELRRELNPKERGTGSPRVEKTPTPKRGMGGFCAGLNVTHALKCATDNIVEDS